VMVSLFHASTVVVVWSVVTALQGGPIRRKRTRKKPYDRPSGRRPFQTALSELKSLQAQYGQSAGMSNLGSGTRDACYSAWKERNKASEASVGVSARRESSQGPFHLDCVSFQRRFHNTTPYNKFSDPFRETFSEEGRLNTF
ncbi:hypothetical protein FOZ62_005171, partial [Perkinsus olseni]